MATEELKNMLYIHCNNIRRKQHTIDATIKNFKNDITKLHNDFESKQRKIETYIKKFNDDFVKLNNELETSQTLLNLMSPTPTTTTTESKSTESKSKKLKIDDDTDNLEQFFQKMYNLEIEYQKKYKNVLYITTNLRIKLLPEWAKTSFNDKAKYASWKSKRVSRE